MNRFGLCVEKYSVRDKGLLRKWYASVVGYTHIGGFIRFLHIKRFINRIKFYKVLDAGCGNGAFSFYIAKKCPDVRIDSFDIEQDNITACLNISNELRFKNVNYFCKDIREINFINQYDLVLLIDVLEHIPFGDSKIVIKNLFKSLQPNGHILIHLPLKDEKRIFNEKLFEKTLKDLKESHRENIWDKEQICCLLINEGFEIRITKNTFGFFGKFLWEIDKILYEKIKPVYIILLPFVKMLCLIEAYLPYKNGSGILILAKKVVK